MVRPLSSRDNRRRVGRDALVVPVPVQ